MITIIPNIFHLMQGSNVHPIASLNMAERVIINIIPDTVHTLHRLQMDTTCQALVWQEKGCYKTEFYYTQGVKVHPMASLDMTENVMVNGILPYAGCKSTPCSWLSLI